MSDLDQFLELRLRDDEVVAGPGVEAIIARGRSRLRRRAALAGGLGALVAVGGLAVVVTSASESTDIVTPASVSEPTPTAPAIDPATSEPGIEPTLPPTTAPATSETSPPTVLPTGASTEPVGVRLADPGSGVVETLAQDGTVIDAIDVCGSRRCDVIEAVLQGESIWAVRIIDVGDEAGLDAPVELVEVDVSTRLVERRLDDRLTFRGLTAGVDGAVYLVANDREILRLRDGAVEVVDEGSDLRASADGRRLAYSTAFWSDGPGEARIQLLDLERDRTSSFTTTGVAERPHEFSPDGEWLIVYSGADFTVVSLVAVSEISDGVVVDDAERGPTFPASTACFVDDRTLAMGTWGFEIGEGAAVSGEVRFLTLGAAESTVVGPRIPSDSSLTCVDGGVRVDSPGLGADVTTVLLDGSFETTLESITYQAEPDTGGLSVGDEGPRVRALQEELTRRGYLPFGDADDFYGRRTETAVADAQSELGLPRTGEADVDTLHALGLDPTRRAVEGPIVITGTALGDVELGAAELEAEDALRTLLGPPDSDQHATIEFPTFSFCRDWEPRVLRWSGIQAIFARYDPIEGVETSEPLLFSVRVRDWSGAGIAPVTTADGLMLGASRADFDALYPNAQFFEDGAGWIALSDDGASIHFGELDEPVSELRAGPYLCED